MGYLDNAGLSYFWEKIKDIFAYKSDIPAASTNTPAALGTAAAGSSTAWARGDHVHAMPSASDVGAIAAPSSGSTGQILAKSSSGTEWANIQDLETIFYAIYGTTTFNEISAAVSAGKACFCKYLEDGKYYLYPLYGSTSTSYTFRVMTLANSNTTPHVADYKVTNSNVWSVTRTNGKSLANGNYTVSAPTKNGTIAVTSDIPSASSATPQPLGTAAAGSLSGYSRPDHVHAMPSLSDLGAASASAALPTGGITGQILSKIDNTDYNVMWTTINASSIGAIAAPSSPSTGAFLTYNGSTWVATTLSAWQGGSY